VSRSTSGRGGRPSGRARAGPRDRPSCAHRQHRQRDRRRGDLRSPRGSGGQPRRGCATRLRRLRPDHGAHRRRLRDRGQPRLAHRRTLRLRRGRLRAVRRLPGRRPALALLRPRRGRPGKRPRGDSWPRRPAPRRRPGSDALPRPALRRSRGGERSRRTPGGRGRAASHAGEAPPPDHLRGRGAVLRGAGGAGLAGRPFRLSPGRHRPAPRVRLRRSGAGLDPQRRGAGAVPDRSPRGLPRPGDDHAALHGHPARGPGRASSARADGPSSSPGPRSRCWAT
jgi:hypothetical protein